MWQLASKTIPVALSLRSSFSYKMGIGHPVLVGVDRNKEQRGFIQVALSSSFFLWVTVECDIANRGSFSF